MIRRLDQKLKELGVKPFKVYLITLSQELVQEMIELELPYNISFEIAGEFDNGLQFAADNHLSSVTVKPKLLNPEQTKRIHNEGIELITFGAKSKSGNKKLLELNPDVIQTNNVNALKELLGR